MSASIRQFRAVRRQDDHSDSFTRRTPLVHAIDAVSLEEDDAPSVGKPPLNLSHHWIHKNRSAPESASLLSLDKSKKSSASAQGMRLKQIPVVAPNPSHQRGGGSAGSSGSGGGSRGGSAPSAAASDAPAQRRAKSSSIAALRKADSDIQRSLKEFFYFYLPDHPMRAQTMRSMIRQGTPVVGDPLVLQPASVEARRVEVYLKNTELKEKEKRNFIAFIADRSNDPSGCKLPDDDESSSDNSCLAEYDTGGRGKSNRSGGKAHLGTHKKTRERLPSFGGV